MEMPKLDARPDRIDLRDREYQPPLKSLEHAYPPPAVVSVAILKYREDGMVLNQGKEGACTGFGLAATINALLWHRAMLKIDGNGNLALNEGSQAPAKVSERMLYHLARFYDEWPGEDYEGSSCRGAIKAWHKHGVCSQDYWPYTKRFIPPSAGWDTDAAERPLGVYYRINRSSVTDMQAAIQDVGAIYCSAEVHEGWSLKRMRSKTVSHDSLPKIAWSKSERITGGHAFCIVGYNRHGFIVQNSWGENWGQMGFGILTYSDWLTNGSDAWVCVMGAPSDIDNRMPDYFISSSLSREKEALRQNPELASLIRLPFGGRSDDPDRKGWNKSKAYKHSIVMGNDGKIINRLVEMQNGSAAVTQIVVDNVIAYFRQNPGSKPRIMLYAHGGLNSEGDAIERVQALGPYLYDNGIYPVFFSWKTGLLETLFSIIADASNRMFPSRGGLSEFIEQARQRMEDALDRTLEVACESLGVKAVWSQMKQNAQAASMRGNSDRGVFLTTLALKELKRMIPGVEIHLVGHSAGSILLGHMLDDFPRNRLTASSCSLYAPACSVDFAIRHYQKAVQKTKILKKKDLYLHLLSDRVERDDTVGPYRKSLLYLVSRALEDFHKTPLMGLDKVYEAPLDDDEKLEWHPSAYSRLKKWRSFFPKHQKSVIDSEEVVTRARWSSAGNLTERKITIKAAHGAFDNDVEVIAETIRRITGKKPLDRQIEDLIY